MTKDIQGQQQIDKMIRSLDSFKDIAKERKEWEERDELITDREQILDKKILKEAEKFVKNADNSIILNDELYNEVEEFIKSQTDLSGKVSDTE